MTVSRKWKRGCSLENIIDKRRRFSW